MKRALTDFFLPCRAFLVVAFLAVTLSGCVPYYGNLPGEQVGNYIERIGQEAIQAQEPLNQKAYDYLQAVCLTDERLFIKPGILLDDGILALRNNRGNAPLPLLEKVPKNVDTPNAIIVYRNWYHEDSWEGSVRAFREIQYGYALPWDSGNLLAAAWSPIPQTGNQKAFIETSDGKYIQRASRAFWERAKLRERVLESSLQMKALRKDKWSEADILRNYEATPMWMPFDLPVDTLNARYALSIEDISTLEDRAHWVGRGRLRLIERDTEEIVAEYVGFMASPFSMIVKQSPSRHWDWFKTEMCPNAEKTFESTPRHSFKKTPARGFLYLIKRAHGKAISNFDTLVSPEQEWGEPSRFLSRFTRKDGSLWIENTALSDFIPLPQSATLLDFIPFPNRRELNVIIPAEKPLPSMGWRNVFLSKYVNVSGMRVRASDNAVFGGGDVTVAGNLLIDGVDSDTFSLTYVSMTGDLSVRDSDFGGDKNVDVGLRLNIGKARRVLFERVRGSPSPAFLDGQSDASSPRTKQVIFRFCEIPITTNRINAEHVRIENSTESFDFGYEYDGKGKRIDRLEIVGSKLTRINLSGVEIDRLEITNSSIDDIGLEDAMIRQWKVTDSRIKKDGHYLEDWQIKLMGEKQP